MPLYLPKVNKLLDEFKMFKEKVELKWKDTPDNAKAQEFDPTQFDHLKFMVNNVK